MRREREREACGKGMGMGASRSIESWSPCSDIVDEPGRGKKTERLRECRRVCLLGGIEICSGKG